MGEFHTFSDIGVNDSMIAHHVSASDRMHPDFGICSLSHQAFTSMENIFGVVESANLGENLREAASRSAWGVFLRR